MEIGQVNMNQAQYLLGDAQSAIEGLRKMLGTGPTPKIDSLVFKIRLKKILEHLGFTSLHLYPDISSQMLDEMFDHTKE